MGMQGRLLQLKLPEEVRPDQSVAQRSKASGNLSISMPKERPPARSSPWASRCPPSETRSNRRTASELQLVLSSSQRLSPDKTCAVGA